MKTIIIYSSKYGCTEDCVKILKSKLNCDSKLVNLKNMAAIDFQQYDWVIIGSSIYVGKIQKEVKLFCKRNLKALSTKNIALFLCCTTPEQANDYFKSNFPPELLTHAMQTVNFGGELRQVRMRFFDKTLTTMIAKVEPKKTGILCESIDSLAALVNSKID